MLFVISAPSGAGKTTIIKELFKENPDIKFSVSCTTRPKRAGEQNGIDYFFLSDKEFDEKLASNEFVEWENVHGKRYGTLKSEIVKYINSPHNLVFDVDVKGALSIKKLYPEAVLIFIDVPKELLLSRLKNRKTETDEQIRKRAERIEMEIKEKDKFDYVVENSEGAGGLINAVNELNKIIKKYN
jgi:guanylate kinase